MGSGYQHGWTVQGVRVIITWKRAQGMQAPGAPPGKRPGREGSRRGGPVGAPRAPWWPPWHALCRHSPRGSSRRLRPSARGIVPISQARKLSLGVAGTG